MQTSIKIIDYIKNKEIFLVFVEEDFNLLKDTWNKRNSFTFSLKSKTNSNFNKLSTISFLEWKMMVLNMIDKFLSLTNEEHHDINNSDVKDYHTLLLGYSYKYFLETGNNLDLLKIQKINSSDFAFILNSSDLIISLDKQK